MKITEFTTLREILESPHAVKVIRKHAPEVLDSPFIGPFQNWKFQALVGNGRLGLTADAFNAIAADLARPAEQVFPDADRRSMDDVDGYSRRYDSPLDTAAHDVTLQPIQDVSRNTAGGTGRDVGHLPAASGTPMPPSDFPRVVSLDGAWQMAEGGKETDRISGDWNDAIPATVPGSVHTALVAAGWISDPTVGRNQIAAKEESFKTWWLATGFDDPGDLTEPVLRFGGVCNRCTVWLNSTRLGDHEGMFGGPEFDVSGLIKERNRLVVRLDPIEIEPDFNESPFDAQHNRSWRKTVVFNNVYGWHYSDMPSLGIWRSVQLVSSPTVSIANPFVATTDADAGQIDIVMEAAGPPTGWSGTVRGKVTPENFPGESYSFEETLQSASATSTTHLRIRIPDHQLWWPVDMGDPNLYRLILSFTPDAGGVSDRVETTFGIRSLDLEPLPEGPAPQLYNWKFVVNGRPMFVKGANWCTIDALMDFKRERYEHFIRLARLQHIQMLRPWGSGMPETDDFYDLCDRSGIMVFQEWPTAWDSHKDQPFDILEETVRLNTVRIRNHPSLVMLAGGNESENPVGEAIEMMGRLSVELDGTRPFHRGEPWGGSVHSYNCHWQRLHLDADLNLIGPFFGEFGIPSSPVFESVKRYTPSKEQATWPPTGDGTFAYHTPVFNRREDISRVSQYAGYFSRLDAGPERFAIASQLAQATGVRHVLERARTRWPDCAGALYYKLNDNFPAISWASVDWYGAPKLAHYVIQSAFLPLRAIVLFRTLNFAGTPQVLPVWLVDDANELAEKEWIVRVRAVNADLRPVALWQRDGRDTIAAPLRLGDVDLSWEETNSTPLFVVAEVIVEGELAGRGFYWTNFEAVKGSVFELPPACLDIVGTGDSGNADMPYGFAVTNTSDVPAVGVTPKLAGSADSFIASAGCAWLDPGEILEVKVSESEGVTVGAWNTGAL